MLVVMGTSLPMNIATMKVADVVVVLQCHYSYEYMTTAGTLLRHRPLRALAPSWATTIAQQYEHTLQLLKGQYSELLGCPLRAPSMSAQ